MKRLKPGSEEALKKGCTCPVMDNRHGRGIPSGPISPNGPSVTLYWMSEDCPLHQKELADARDKSE